MDMTYSRRLDIGSGSLTQQFIAFWHDGERQQTSEITIHFPPHEPPRGGILDDFVRDALRAEHPEVKNITLNGAVALMGADREISLGDGRVGSVVLLQDGWTVYI